jgi:hypothetical protein
LSPRGETDVKEMDRYCVVHKETDEKIKEETNKQRKKEIQMLKRGPHTRIKFIRKLFLPETQLKIIFRKK